MKIKYLNFSDIFSTPKGKLTKKELIKLAKKVNKALIKERNYETNTKR